MALVVSTGDPGQLSVNESAHLTNVVFYGSWGGNDFTLKLFFDYGIGAFTTEFAFIGNYCDVSGNFNQTIALTSDKSYIVRARLNAFFNSGFCIAETFVGVANAGLKSFKSWAVTPVNSVDGVASSITATDALLTFSDFKVNTDESTGTAQIEYRKQGDATWIPVGSASGTLSGYGTQSLARTASGLLGSTIYEYRITITRTTSNVTVWSSSIYTFTTSASVPTIQTDPASYFAPTAASLNGTVDPNFNSTTYYFEYGLTTGYGTTTGSLGPNSGGSPLGYQQRIYGLLPTTLYHFRAVLSYSGGILVGSDRTFTTTVTRENGSVWVEGTDLHWISDGVNWRSTGGSSGAVAGKVGSIWVEGNDLHYIDSSGNERTLVGVDGGVVAGKMGSLWIDGTVNNNLYWIDASNHKRSLLGVNP